MLHLPATPPARHAARPRLLAALDGDPQVEPNAEVVLLRAGAGWGKTVLMQQWAAQAGEPVVLVSADPSPTFWTATRAALREAGLLTAPEDNPADPLDEVTGPGTLIIDDVDELADTAPLDALLRRRHPVRVILACREDPGGVRLMRLRLAETLREITATELAMSVPEIEAVLRDPALATSVSELTDGWPAAVALIAGWLADHPVGEDILAESGVDELVTSAVTVTWDTDSYHTARLLGCVPSFCGELANAICGSTSANGRLGHLYAISASFLRQDVHRPRWLRFLAPVRHTLQRDFGALPSADQRAARSRAAHWLSAEGLWEPAIEQAVAGSDGRLLIDALLDGAFRGWLIDIARTRPRSRSAVFGAPLQQTADELLAHSVTLNRQWRVASAAVKVQLNDPLAALAHLRRGRSSTQDARTRLVARLVELVAAHQCEQDADVRALSDELVTELSDEDPRLAASIRYHQADFLWAQGGSTHGLDGLLNDAVDLARRADDDAVVLSGLQLLSVIDADGNRRRKASATLAMSAALARRSGNPLDARYDFASGLIALHDNDLDTAEAAAQASEIDADHVLIGLSGRPNTALDGIRMLRLWCRLARGDVDAALHLASELEQRLPVLSPRRHDDALLTLAELDIRHGHPQRALERVRAAVKPTVWVSLTAAHAHLTLGAPEAAQQRLDRIVRNADAALPRGALTTAFLLEAGAAASLGNDDDAVRWVHRALDLAADARHLFVSVTRLLQPLIARHPEIEARWPIALRDGAWIDLAADAREPATVERASAAVFTDRVRLTPRETSVLQLLVDQLELAEIATRLNLSKNTVKTHVRMIYHKLGVGNRRDAVLRAQRVELR